MGRVDRRRQAAVFVEARGVYRGEVDRVDVSRGQRGLFESLERLTGINLEHRLTTRVGRWNRTVNIFKVKHFRTVAVDAVGGKHCILMRKNVPYV